MTVRLLFPLSLALLLAACDIPGLGPDPRTLAKEADGKAIGGACRYSARSIEDCYAMNEEAPRAAVFAGWKDMDQYMRENKVDAVPPKMAAKPEPVEEVVVDKPKKGSKAAASKGGGDKAVAVAVAKEADKSALKPAEKAAPAKAAAAH